MTKKLLFISRQAPYGNTRAREALDATLAASVYDQQLSLLFMDDGVLQLVVGQDSAGIDQKNLSKQLSALPLYDISPLYVHRQSLAQRGLAPQDLFADDIELLDSEQVQALIAQQDHILSF